MTWTHDLAANKTLEFGFQARGALSLGADGLDRSASDQDRKRITLEPREARRCFMLTEHTAGIEGAACDRRCVDPAANENALSIPEQARRFYRATLDRLDYDAKVDFSGAERRGKRRIGQCCDYAARVRRHVPVGSDSGADGGGVLFPRLIAGGMHVWAEFFVDGVGWAPCDLSMGDAGPHQAERSLADDGRRVAVTRDLDLRIDLGKGADASLVQEYLMRYRDQPTRGDVCGPRQTVGRAAAARGHRSTPLSPFRVQLPQYPAPSILLVELIRAQELEILD